MRLGCTHFHVLTIPALTPLIPLRRRLGDGIWVTAEIVYYAKTTKAIRGSPTQYVTSLWVTDAYIHLLHVVRDNGWDLEVDFELKGVETRKGLRPRTQFGMLKQPGSPA
eukprot:7852409-Pyramimonas_sp.AAC.1